MNGNNTEELAGRSVQKHANRVRLFRQNNHICNVTKINAGLKAFRCPRCDTFFFEKIENLERYLTKYSERVKHLFPKNVYQVHETMFNKLDSFGIKYTRERKLFKNLALLDFESTCVQEETFENTNVDREACPNFSTHFLNRCGKTNFPFKL